MIELILWISAWYLIIGVLLFVTTWRSFVIIMKHKNLLKNIKTLPFKYYWIVPVGVIGWIGDVLWNVFYATPLFLQLPDIHGGMRVSDITLSHRLRQILRHDTSIKESDKRWSIADTICSKFIEPHDCDHCGR